MLSYLAGLEEYFGPFRLFASITLRTMLAAVTAMLLGFASGPRLIRSFRRLKLGHGYVDERTVGLGPGYFDKKHTPTMGGLIIFLSVFGSSVLWAAPNIWVIVSLFVYAALTVPGFPPAQQELTVQLTRIMLASTAIFCASGMVTGILPVVGVTLPLFSYGGSSAITIRIRRISSSPPVALERSRPCPPRGWCAC